MKIIVLGGTGLLGQALQLEIIKRNYKCYSVARTNADFEYHSGNNDRWLTVEDMKKLISEM